MDISRIPLADLLQLLETLPDEIEKRRMQERVHMLEELAALARARGFVLEDLVRMLEKPVEDSRTPPIIQRRPAPVKFRHPFNGELTWSGRGRQKKWVVAWLAEGRKMEDLMV